MAYYIPQIIYTAFFWEWRQKDLFGFQSHSLISWDERWRTCFEVWGHISLSVRPLFFHPRLLSRATPTVSSVYSSYCITYTWRVWSLFIDRTPTAWAHCLDHFGCCFSPNLLSPCVADARAAFMQTREHLGTRGSWKNWWSRPCVKLPHTSLPVYIYVNLWKSGLKVNNWT